MAERRAALLPAVLLLAACSSAPGEAPPSASTPPPAPSAQANPQGAAQAPPAAPAAPAAAAIAEPAWFPWYDWALEVDGKPAMEAMFFREKNGRRLIISVPGLSRSVLINTAGQHVYPLDAGLVTIGAEGESAELAADAESRATGSTYTTAGNEVVFYLGSNRLKITPKEPLEGQATREEIFAHTPLYAKGMKSYVPEAAEISYLRSFKEPVEIEVFFGTWCPHCKILVPKFMKALELAANPSLKVRYIGVPKTFNTYGPASSRGVQGIPTFIFAHAGKEFGRIPGEPASGTIEHAMAEILRGLSR